MEQGETEALLTPYRALDLTDEKGMLCGKILGDLGVDVIKIEKPGGDPARSIGPFYRDVPEPERSLYWFAFNNNKRGVTLDIERADGRAIFKRLAKSADFVIESFAPGYMEALGLGYSDLSQINPRIILTSISPFGQTGPYRDYKTSDLVSMAMGGWVYLCGDADRPPVRFSVEQAYCHVSMEAAAGTMVAHYYREATQEGQQVDVSIQECVSGVLSEAPHYWEMAKVNVRREGSGRRRPTTGVVIPEIYPCQDGYVAFIIMGGLTGEKLMTGITEMIGAPYLKNMEWRKLDYATMTQEYHDRIAAPIREYFMAHTKAELYAEAVKRRLFIYPVSDVKDALESPQLKARHFWVEVAHPELGHSITYPGPFVNISELPCGIRRRAPLIGEHNVEIYQKELGLTSEELITLKEGGII